MILRTQTLAGEYDHVVESDPALNPGKGAKGRQEFVRLYNKAVETGDFKELPLHPGKKPIVWRLSHLTGEQVQYVRDVLRRPDGGVNQAFYVAVQLALVAVDGLLDDKGVAVEIERAHDVRRRGWAAVCDEQMLALTRMEGVLDNLGARVVSEFLPHNG